MKSLTKLFSGVVVIALAALSLSTFTACKSGSKPGDSTATSSMTILGAGSSFVNPLFSKMFSEYNTKTGVKVNYQSIGSGAGIQQLTAKTVDFGASDAPLNGKQDSALSAPAIHIPITAG